MKLVAKQSTGQE